MVDVLFLLDQRPLATNFTSDRIDGSNFHFFPIQTFFGYNQPSCFHRKVFLTILIELNLMIIIISIVAISSASVQQRLWQTNLTYHLKNQKEVISKMYMAIFFLALSFVAHTYV